MRLGDGIGLVARFLEEAGIPKATRQAVGLLPLDMRDQLLPINDAASPQLVELIDVAIAAQLTPIADKLKQSLLRRLQLADDEIHNPPSNQ